MFCRTTYGPVTLAPYRKIKLEVVEPRTSRLGNPKRHNITRDNLNPFLHVGKVNTVLLDEINDFGTLQNLRNG